MSVFRSRKNTLVSFFGTNYRCQFYYMDQFLLSASSHKLFVHQIGLPQQQQTQQQSTKGSKDELWFKNAHTFDMDQCKSINSFCAPNQVSSKFLKLFLYQLFNTKLTIWVTMHQENCCVTKQLKPRWLDINVATY